MLAESSHRAEPSGCWGAVGNVYTWMKAGAPQLAAAGGGCQRQKVRRPWKVLLWFAFGSCQGRQKIEPSSSENKVTGEPAGASEGEPGGRGRAAGPELVPDPGSEPPQEEGGGLGVQGRGWGCQWGLPVGPLPHACMRGPANTVGQCLSWVPSCLQDSEGRMNFCSLVGF